MCIRDRGGGWLCRVPLELVLLALGCAVLMNGVPSSAVTSNFDGSIAAVLRDEFSVDLPSAANTMANLLCAGLLFLFLEVTFMSVLALRQGCLLYTSRYTSAFGTNAPSARIPSWCTSATSVKR